MISGIELFRVTGDRMRYLTERQSVIARNIANADTPDYKARDLAPFNPVAPKGGFGNVSSSLSLVQTNPAHLQLDDASGGVQGAHTIVTDAAYGEKPNGNTVSVEEQMVKSADVTNAFAMASAAYAKSISVMKIATGGR
jgi:flagellar basal-body rod protein FlgB